MCNTELSAFICMGSTIFLVAFGILIVTFILPMINYYDYKLHECNITSVLVPNNVPMNNTYLWKPCKCGRKCSSLTPCIKLYTSISPGQMIKNKYYSDRNSDCTFQSDKCDNDLVSLINSLSKSQEYIDNYLNKTVDCYYDNQMTNIYLEREINMYFGYIYSAFTLLLFLCLLFIIIKSCSRHKPKPINEEDKYEKLFMNKIESHLL